MKRGPEGRRVERAGLDSSAYGTHSPHTAIVGGFIEAIQDARQVNFERPAVAQTELRKMRSSCLEGRTVLIHRLG